QGKAKELQTLMKVQSTDEFLKHFRGHSKDDIENSSHPAARLKRAKKEFHSALSDQEPEPEKKEPKD
ncbi:MAG: hypothetical protein CEO21_296, partial [Microgenomates group bacterium Gr01-1014_80]